MRVRIRIKPAMSLALKKRSALAAKRYLSARAERGKKVNIDAILAKVPSVEPEPHDRISE